MSIWKSGPYIAFLFVVLMISVGILLAAWRTSHFYQELLSRGIVTKAEVTAEEVSQGFRGGNIHYFHYRYKDSKDAVHSAKTGTIVLNVGELVDVTYLQNDPARHVTFRMNKKAVWQPVKVALEFDVMVVGVTIAFGLILQLLLNKENCTTINL